MDLTDLLGDLPARGRLANLFVSLTAAVYLGDAASSGSLSQVDIYSDLRGTGHYTTTAVPRLPTTVAAGGPRTGSCPCSPISRGTIGPIIRSKPATKPESSPGTTMEPTSRR